MSHTSIVSNPFQFASEWYKPEEIHRSITSCRSGGFGPTVEIPQDVHSIEFSNWLAEQYRLAMTKGATLAIEELKCQR